MAHIRLLVLEQCATQRELIRKALCGLGAGVDIRVAGSMAEALGLDLAGFELILTDYGLHPMTGPDLLDQLRARCATPVVILARQDRPHAAAESIHHGAMDYVVKTVESLRNLPILVWKNLAIAQVRRGNEALRARLGKALSESVEKNRVLEASLKQVEELAATDPLTGLYNRRHFAKVVEQLFAEAQRYGKDMACVMIDLDAYKDLNDTLGHQAGDELLVLASRVITANLRRMDVAARYGGDEFVLLLPQASADDAAKVAERINEEFKPASGLLLARDCLTMSIGVGSLVTNRARDPGQLIACADAALYRSKRGGRDRITVASFVGPRKPAGWRG